MEPPLEVPVEPLLELLVEPPLEVLVELELEATCPPGPDVPVLVPVPPCPPPGKSMTLVPHDAASATTVRGTGDAGRKRWFMSLSAEVGGTSRAGKSVLAGAGPALLALGGLALLVEAPLHRAAARSGGAAGAGDDEGLGDEEADLLVGVLDVLALVAGLLARDLELAVAVEAVDGDGLEALPGGGVEAGHGGEIDPDARTDWRRPC